MEILAGKMEWLVTDEQNLAAFLDTPTGQRLIPKLLEEAPALLESGDINSILIRSGKVRGYQEIALAILSLAHPAPKSNNEQTVSALPPLEDDSQWPAPKAEPALEYQEPPPPAPQMQSDTNPTTPTI